MSMTMPLTSHSCTSTHLQARSPGTNSKHRNRHHQANTGIHYYKAEDISKILNLILTAANCPRKVKSGYLKQKKINHGTNIIPALLRPLPLMWACQ